MTAVRKFHPRTLILTVTAGVLLLTLAIATWSFINPRSEATAVRLASVEDFAPGTVTAFRIDGAHLRQLRNLESHFGSAAHGAVAPRISGDTLLYVVRLPNGEFRVLSGRSTHLGQVIEWRPDLEPEVGTIRGAFFGWGTCPLWAVDGTRIFGPAPRDMDRYDFHIEDGFLVVDIGERREGARSGANSLVVAGPYDVLDPDWPTSGWPSR